MSMNTDNVKDNASRRQFLGLAGAFLGVAGASVLLPSNSAEAAEKFPAKLYESLTAYATKVSKDKRDLTAIRKELEQLVNELKNGQDLEKLCQTLINARPELARILKPYQGGGDAPSCIIVIIIIIIIILASTSDLF
jgi:hypothetical protein